MTASASNGVPASPQPAEAWLARISELRSRTPWTPVAVTAIWLVCLAYSTLAARVLYADGAWYVLVHLITGNRFNDYDAQRSFASFISQAPLLAGQKFGVDSVSIYAALYGIGVFVIPAIAMICAMFLARRSLLMLAANVFAVVVFGFSANFINTESNLLFGLVWLSVTILALPQWREWLAGYVLPLIAFALLRVYEGMLLVGPILSLWAFMESRRATNAGEAFGLRVASLLFAIGAVIGMGGFLAPRDPGNASSFVHHAVYFLKNPQFGLFVCAGAAFVSVLLWRKRTSASIAAGVVSVLAGAWFLYALARLNGYYSYEIYHQNRSFLVLLLPFPVAALALTSLFRPAWLLVPPTSWWRVAWMVFPMVIAAAGDLHATHQWVIHVSQFCAVLRSDSSPVERRDRLVNGGSLTGWRWTHPAMSVLLRDRGSAAMVVNEPTAWEPFSPAAAPVIRYRGLCEAGLIRWPAK
jgi:hypothetical protein